MPASSLASPLCTWLVASCMSCACEKDQAVKSPFLFQSPNWRSRLDRRRKVMATQCGNGGGVGGLSLSCGLISCWCGSGIQNLMSTFAPCEDYYNSSKWFSSLALFGENGFSPFGSKTVPVTRRQRRMNSAAQSGNAVALAVQPIQEDAIKKKPLSKKRRVVVTGLGVVTPLGFDADIFYNNLLEGISGISEIEAFDCAQFPTRIAGEIKSFSADGWVAPKLSKRADKFMLYLLTAGKKALVDGGITKDIMCELNKAKCGIVIGSSLGGMQVFNDAIEALQVSYKKMNPFCIPFATSNMGSAMLAIDLGWMGPNYSISAACATSNFCILNAANHIARGESDIMLCGGSDAAIIPIGLGGFVACGALSQRNTNPTKASRPWDINRDGFVMGEGAGVLLLEELEHAKKRGANIYAEFLGGSSSFDAYHMIESHPDGTGIFLCMEKALAQSGVGREDVNYVNAHATSTPTGDLKEYQAIIQCFGRNPVLRVNSSKSMTGHLLGAAGAVEAVATIKAIQTGWLHPNINLENPDESTDMNILVGSKKEHLEINVALSNSFGFGGHNSSILFAPYKNTL
ncbi:3-oxoacyl-[acyl-carrier-protein] synthase II, chloroplastic-like [Actinidia eriantha]|uniref:3-oxoacyl-[acyl-carrier-protein] synthase II, chloroplastic-like n=1 Tax=Actinidia eriantha TaxID=165200 RepID=UPI00258D63ED|nr:3-oxoacyl-[acyl-carrier-protein] synthase II, chloroplastic-like [Actinidia eriantha]XP_057505222.1 3-oxoacyl-[acyl-carrier-protein] synthase II, chloroplastic-like [Actinidia eriantha]XP_057505223.1 3-oxoacyl-[acyl-carrier-protein] synthase II, chloroplastic-like [Actinidia eriantha]XP_057505224.1 3-oxoacyl-[acyl-carrier-protein] synthase II, chloroplastic-like [Actinidia eriantha]XP_057505226.1 3-oxoacyl-[acyl-carrier-protein] synthase II, chloroplastic-like [Actinidia eriantha]